MTFALGLIYILVVGAVLVSMIVLLLKGKKELYNRIYLVCQSLVVVWCVSQLLLLLSHTDYQLAISYGIGNVGICFIGAFWYYFAVVYAGGVLSGLRKLLPILLSVFHYGLVLTNKWHHMYYKEFGKQGVEHGFFFYSNVVVTYLWVVAGAVILYRNLNREEDENGGRGLIIASVLIPIFLNVVNLFGGLNTSFDITPLGFALSVICVLRATIKYRFLDLRKELEITNEKLILEKERNRIAQEVHDTAGHTLTMIQSYMKLAGVANAKGESKQVDNYLSEAKILTGQGIKELRESINAMREGVQYQLVTQGVMQLANQVKELSVEVTVQGEDSERYSHLSRVIYDSVRETITNTLKYAQASKIEIVLRFTQKAVDVTIGDDGVGCEMIEDNNGLRGIRERVEKAGGKVRFISGKGEGFLTRIHLDVHS